MLSLVLFSGGMDSTVTLFNTLMLARKEVMAFKADADLERLSPANLIGAISFDYGQRHRKELEVATTIIEIARKHHPEYMGAHMVLKIPLGTLIPASSSLLDPSIPINTQHQEGVLDPAFIPHRNALFLTIAAMWARSLRTHTIYTGLRGGFADCTEEFEESIEQMFAVSDPDWPIHVISPVHCSRKDTVMRALSLTGCMEALSYSLTCFEGTTIPCGKCLPCTKRAEGFAQAGIEDPLLKRIAGESKR